MADRQSLHPLRSLLLTATGLAFTGACLAQAEATIPDSTRRDDTLPAGIHASDVSPRSGLDYQSGDLRALQDDDFANPGMLWVDRGAALWRRPGPGGEPSCQACHGEPRNLRGVANRYPVYDAHMGSLVNLEGRINQCRTLRQDQPALDYESDPLLALTALVAHQSRGLPIDVSIDGPAQPYFEEGRQYFYTRRGQMNLACYHCHELNAGNYLRGDRLSQGQPTGYPLYRVDWQTLGSLQRRLRFCNSGVRAQPHDFGAPIWLSLELFLRWRAQGLEVETPAVRR
jgi:sulfur-oxidizing protein SoxA